MKRPGKWTMRILRELSREAFSRERRVALEEVAFKVDSWTSDHVSDDDLANFLWRHQTGPAKDLGARYGRLDPEFLVANAVAEGVLEETEIPEELRADILAKAAAITQVSRGFAYQFRISIKGIAPRIWRQILVPERYSFWDLHVAIQDSMGWQDQHLHEFRIQSPTTGTVDRIGLPEAGGYQLDTSILSSSRVLIAERFSLDNSVADYIYDFGDDWDHSVVLEDIIPAASNAKCPSCIGGERACPPENVGGIPGYQELLASLGDPQHPEHDRYVDWVGGSFSPETFNAQEVQFEDPQERWKQSFG